MSSAPTPSGAPRTNGWSLAVLLTALNTLGYVDRQLVAALGPVLMAEFHLTRADLGFLIGPAFIVVFSLGTLLLGVAADRWSRPRILALGLAVWSLATALTGTAASLASLVVWRALVGVGEATLPPTAVAMLGDRFPPSRLGFVSSVYYAGIPVGFGLSLALAGAVVPRFGWRVCFGVLGCVGLLGAGFVWRLTDGPGAARRSEAKPDGQGSVSRLKHALRQEPRLVLLALAAALITYASASSQHVVTWLVQQRGFEFSKAAYLSSVMVLLAGLAGSLGLGAITDAGAKRSRAGRLPAFTILGAVALASAVAFYVLPPSTPWFFVAWFVAQGWALGWFGPMMATLHELAPPASKATVLGFVLMVANLGGVALGPWITGAIGDRAGLTAGLLSSVVVGLLGLVVVALVVRRPAAPRLEAG